MTFLPVLDWPTHNQNHTFFEVKPESGSLDTRSSPQANFQGLWAKNVSNGGRVGWGGRLTHERNLPQFRASASRISCCVKIPFFASAAFRLLLKRVYKASQWLKVPSQHQAATVLSVIFRSNWHCFGGELWSVGRSTCSFHLKFSDVASVKSFTVKNTACALGMTWPSPGEGKSKRRVPQFRASVSGISNQDPVFVPAIAETTREPRHVSNELRDTGLGLDFSSDKQKDTPAKLGNVMWVLDRGSGYDLITTLVVCILFTRIFWFPSDAGLVTHSHWSEIRSELPHTKESCMHKNPPCP